MAKILIVEDSPTQMEGIKRMVENMGHFALCAKDGSEAVGVAKNQNPDLILMDIIMPNVNGFQATRTLSKDLQTAHIPIVILTTKNSNTDKVWGLRQGAKAYISKPFKDHELIEVMNNLLGHIENQETNKEVI